jgi:intracellular sulfur oxidation DsrE/DsrF family protein
VLYGGGDGSGESIDHERSQDVNLSAKPLHIDVPVKMTDVKMVFSIGALSFEGDLPASIFHMQLIENDVGDWRANSEVIAVFHANAGHVTRHDAAFNADRNIATGNPYKNLCADLIKRGVRVELCGATARVHGWGNADLLPDIKVNADAMAWTRQLVQEGFVKITE